MRYLNYPLFNASDASGSQTSSAIDATFILQSSIQIITTGTDAAGTVSVQVSNDKIVDANLAQAVQPTNWSTISSLDVTITGNDIYLIPKFDLSYTWLRLSYESTLAGEQLITTVADVASSLSGTYFLISSPSVDYYVYITVDGIGVNPMVPGRTGVILAISEDDSAATIAGLLETTLDGIAGTPFAATDSGDEVTVVNTAAGAFLLAEDVDTGFTFALLTDPGTISANLKTIGM